MKDGRPKRGMNRDLALKVLALCKLVKDALDDLLGTMFIIYQPKTWVGALGEIATITVVAMNVVTYRWQYSDNGVNWTNSSATLNGYNTPTISFVMEERYVSRYRRCRLTDANGNYLYTDVVQTLLNEEET